MAHMTILPDVMCTCILMYDLNNERQTESYDQIDLPKDLPGVTSCTMANTYSMDAGLNHTARNIYGRI